jgi:hypothetical protein
MLPESVRVMMLVVDVFERLQIPYLIGGSMASALYEISDRQWRDILGVLKVQAGRLDVDYLKKWATELNVTDLLEGALKESE